VSLALLSKLIEKGETTLPTKFYSIVSWKTQNRQNQKVQNGNLVAPLRNSASTINPDGNASHEPKHLSFLIGGTGKT
jgi:hypothetical protein